MLEILTSQAVWDVMILFTDLQERICIIEGPRYTCRVCMIVRVITASRGPIPQTSLLAVTTILAKRNPSHIDWMIREISYKWLVGGLEPLHLPLIYIRVLMSNEKNLGWLFDIGDYTTQLYGDNNKPL